MLSLEHLHSHLEFFIGMSCGAIIMLASLLVLMRNGVPDRRLRYGGRHGPPGAAPTIPMGKEPISAVAPPTAGGGAPRPFGTTASHAGEEKPIPTFAPPPKSPSYDGMHEGWAPKEKVAPPPPTPKAAQVILYEGSEPPPPRRKPDEQASP